jgi:hypothetical protein
MAWYREAVAADPSADPARAAEMAARVIRYNEDDVLATLAVRRWISDHLDELPTVADLDTDEPWVSGAASAVSRPAG